MNSMTAAVRDDLARLSVALVAGLKRAEAIETVAAMYDVSEHTAADLIERGRQLAKERAA